LAKAISFNAGLKEHAKKEESFRWLWEDGEFKKLTD